MEFRISIAQINPRSGDLNKNADLIHEAIARAREESADLVVLPEMCLTGYCLDEKLLLNRQFLWQNKMILHQKIVPACREIAAIVGFVDFEEEKQGPNLAPVRYNAAAVIQDGKLLQIVHKRLLPSYRYFDDKRYFTPGTEIEPVRLRVAGRDVPIGVLICEDLWDEAYELKPCGVYAGKGVEYIFCINASPFVCSSPGRNDGKRAQRDELIRRQTKRYGVPIISVNTAGVGDNGKNIIPFDGFSSAYTREGEVAAVLASFETDQRTISFADGNAPSVEMPRIEREQEIFDALVMGVRDYYHKIGIFNGVLEAVSGGIDSALGAVIALEALGPDLLKLYNLPSKYNSATTRGAAEQLARNLGVEYNVVPIQPMVDRVLADFEAHLHPVRQPITVENLQARVRGLIMMAEANDLNALLLANGNETEMALGYATLYGDMVGGLAVIGDLPKADVYRVSEYVNRRWERELIPREIFEIPASAELSEGQVDPFDYGIVSPLVSDFVERGWSVEDLVRLFLQRELPPERYLVPGVESIYDRYSVESFEQLARRLYRSINYAVYKRVQAAPIIAVSERAFGFDLRETIINGWSG